MLHFCKAQQVRLRSILDCIKTSLEKLACHPKLAKPAGMDKRRVEERGGFEPPIPFTRDNRFRGDRFRPLSHLSKTNFLAEIIDYNSTRCLTVVKLSSFATLCHIDTLV